MIRVVTDSSSDLSPAVAADAGIEVVPLTIRFGEREFTDRVDLSASEFWRMMEEAEDLPTTAAPSVGSFEAAYRRLADDGATGIVAVCISSDLSATFRSAQLAAPSSPVPVSVIDSRTTSVSLGLIARALAGSVGELAEAERRARQLQARTGLIAALDTLENLQKGGRIGGAQAFFGGLLNIKPLITVNEGVVEAAGRVRTRTKALSFMATWLRERNRPTAAAIVHGDAPDVAAFADQVADIVGFDPDVFLAGPVVGTHAGPRLIGVAILEP
jgi:DegV family protein with EDD domain